MFKKAGFTFSFGETGRGAQMLPVIGPLVVLVGGCRQRSVIWVTIPDRPGSTKSNNVVSE